MGHIGWTRAAAIELAESAMHAGLMPDGAHDALQLGARLLAHGITSAEVDRMLLDYYQVLAKAEEMLANNWAHVTWANATATHREWAVRAARAALHRPYV